MLNPFQDKCRRLLTANDSKCFDITLSVASRNCDFIKLSLLGVGSLVEIQSHPQILTLIYQALVLSTPKKLSVVITLKSQYKYLYLIFSTYYKKRKEDNPEEFQIMKRNNCTNG